MNISLKHLDFDKIMESGKTVLRAEAEAISLLVNALDDNFIKAIKLLSNSDSRVIVSGMGKSGHVGKKIASTMASTGQPSFFVHPAEASHGDLGMITAQDKLLLLSNNGESQELRSIIDYGRRFSLPIVAITSKPQSTLARIADITLILPSVSEACPMGLAPTTSTIMTMALGDALAISMLAMRNFTPTDFKTFHPGGNLGKQLAIARDYMHVGNKLPLLPLGTTMDECLVKISAYGFGCMGIVDNHRSLRGVITDGDLRRHMHPNLLQDKVEQIMTEKSVTINPEMLMAEVLAIMNKKNITSLFVVKSKEEQKPIGILHIHDCLRAGVA